MSEKVISQEPSAGEPIEPLVDPVTISERAPGERPDLPFTVTIEDNMVVVSMPVEDAEKLIQNMGAILGSRPLSELYMAFTRMRFAIARAAVKT